METTKKRMGEVPTAEFQPAISDNFLETLFKNNLAEKAGEGANGTVFKIDLNRLSKEQKEILFEILPAFSEDNPACAMKLLKIYSSESASRELILQNSAKELLESDDSPVKGRVISPMALRAHTAQIHDPQIIDDLNHLYHIKIDEENPQACYIMMDFIEGQTLEEIETKSILNAHREELSPDFPDSDPEELINGLDENDRRNIVRQIIGKREANDFTDYCDALGEELNGSEVYNKQTYQLIKQAIEFLHQKGLFHRDLHLGNIMIGNDGKIYIIDFDQAKLINPDHEEEVSQVYDLAVDIDSKHGKRNLNDDWIIKHLERLSQTQEDIETSRKNTLAEKNLGNIIARKNSLWSKFYEATSNAEDQSVEELASAFASRFATPGLGSEYMEYLIAALIGLSENGREKECLDYATKKLEGKLSSREQNLLSNFIEYIF